MTKELDKFTEKVQRIKSLFILIYGLGLLTYSIVKIETKFNGDDLSLDLHEAIPYYFVLMGIAVVMIGLSQVNSIASAIGNYKKK